MPTVHQYHERSDTVQALQVHPSVKRGALEAFCPSFKFTASAGIDFPQEGRPEQSELDAPFFTIPSGMSGLACGYLYDWIVKYPDGDYTIVTEADFARRYQAV